MLRVEPEPIEAKDQDVGINAPIKYTIQGGILSFLNLNSETAEITLLHPLMEHELSTSITMVIKVIECFLFILFCIKEKVKIDDSSCLFIKATQIDNQDRYSLATVIVTRGNYHDMSSSYTSM